MSRARRIWLWVGGGFLSLLLVLVVAGVVIVQTEWFRNMVRQKIVGAVETGTGGKAEIGSFSFDWRRLRAEIHEFVIHGLEPANTAPLLRAKLVLVDLRLISPFKGAVDIHYLLVDTPQANVIVYPDGHTNVPAPKVKATSDKSALETVVDLAVGRFDLRNGSLMFAGRMNAIEARGENLRALLAYNHLLARYTGTVEVSPLYWNGLPLDVKLPLTLEKDKIVLANALFTTRKSQVVVTGAMEHLVAPRTSAHVNARVALEDVQQMVKLGIPLDTVHGPGIVNANVTAFVEGARIQVQSARVSLGQTNLEASGTLQDVKFQSTLALAELGRLFRVDARPEGTARVGGNAALADGGNYRVTANLDARNVAFRQAGTRIAGISLDTSITADRRRIELDGLRLGALGGSLTGSATVEEMERFRLNGDLHNFDIDQMARLFQTNGLGYGGVISGPVQATGDFKDPSAVVAHAGLSIAPGRRGVPVSGRLNVDYDGRADSVTVARSYLALPHTRVDLSGSLGRQIQVKLVSSDLRDFQPLGTVPVVLKGGTATVNASVNGKLSAPRLSGQVEVTNFSVEGRPFTQFRAAVEASQSGASVGQGLLARGPLEARFDASFALHNWKPDNSDPLRANVTMRNADVQDLLALAGQTGLPVTGALTLDAHIDGTIANPLGNAEISVLNGTVEGERFDSLVTRVVMTPGVIEAPSLVWIAGPSRIQANATYRHAADSLARGDFRVHVASNQVQLAQFQSLVNARPGLGGVVTLNLDAAGKVAGDVQVSQLNGNAAVRGLQMEGKNLGDLTATANTNGSAIQYAVNSDFAGSTIRVNGQSMLTGKHETTANAVIANLPIDRTLAVAGQRGLPVNGTLSATAQVSGTVDDPRVAATLTISNGRAYEERFDRLQGAISYTPQLIQVNSMRLDAGASNVELTASFAHPANSFADGEVKFQLHSNAMQLASLRTVQQAKPGIAGVVEVVAEGAATLRHNAAPLFSKLDARVISKNLAVDKKPVGDLTLTAETRGKELAFRLNSDFARANIQGSGRMELAGDYPLNAQLSFANVTWSGLGNWIGGAVQPFDASVTGEVNVSGPVTRVDELRGTVQIGKLEAHSVAAANGKKPRVAFELHNEGPVVVALERGVVTIRNARITGPFTNLAITGTAGLRDPQALNLRADGNIKLEVLESFDSDIFSSGSVVLNAAVTGSTAKPVVNGRLQLQNASFNTLTAPNGLSNANGTISFNGTEAVIQSLTGESGGGKIVLSGYAGYGGPEVQFRLQATADGVRIGYPPTVTTQTSARLTLVGTTSRSLLSGNVLIQDVALHSHSDVGSVLSSAAAPPSSPSASTGFLAGMRFDVNIQTAPDVEFRTALTQNLQADANLTLRGNADHPGMLGRATVTQGEVIFFGSKYTIDQGTISFFNPQKIDPILNVDLETSVQGVDVTLSVSGPIDRLKLSYRSDPPLQLSEIISLLASGKPPTSDPVLAARQPVAPQQSFQQTGASTLLGQAVGNPVSGRLQRLFGVSKLKIDPQITGSSNTPQATLTLQQQISREVTFTYIQDVTQSNPTIVRVEWAINPHWSAIAGRDVNGQVDVDLFFKKRFW